MKKPEIGENKNLVNWLPQWSADLVFFKEGKTWAPFLFWGAQISLPEMEGIKVDQGVV